jgi:hypothetical protein
MIKYRVSGVIFSIHTDLYFSSTNKTDLHEITEILLNVAFNTIIPTPLVNLCMLPTWTSE